MINFDEKKEEIAIMRRYLALGLSENRETELREIVFKQHAQSLLSIFTDHDIDPAMYSTIPKTELARLVWSHNQDCPALKTGILCAKLGISQGYFRELRQVKIVEWQTAHIDYRDLLAADAIGGANDPSITDAEWGLSGQPLEYRKLLKI